MVIHENYKHMAEWWKFQHSHEYNILGAVFENKENLTEEDVVAIATNVAIPFNMQMIEINSKCETFAKILFLWGEKTNVDKCELSYSIEMLQCFCFVPSMKWRIKSYFMDAFLCSVLNNGL